MDEQRIAIKSLDRAGALQSLREIRSRAGCGTSLCLDFSSLGRSEPLGMILFAAALKTLRAEIRKSLPNVSFRSVGFEGKSYQAHMGFFQMFGLDYGNLPDAATGNARYEPIRFLSLEEMKEEAANEYLDVREVIERRSHGLARLLVRDAPQDSVDTLGYCLREIVRNSLEHADVDGVWYCAQYWPTRDLVELAILDQGKGVRESLSRNPRLDIDSDEAALKQAILPGVSGVAFKGARIRHDDVWRNSGFGLYMTSRLVGADGNFFIGSGCAGVEIDAGRARSVPFEFQGTVISMQLKPSKVSNLAEALASLRDQASNSRKGDNGRELSASMSSVMLSKDFNKNMP